MEDVEDLGFFPFDSIRNDVGRNNQLEGAFDASQSAHMRRFSKAVGCAANLLDGLGRCLGVVAIDIVRDLGQTSCSPTGPSNLHFRANIVSIATISSSEAKSPASASSIAFLVSSICQAWVDR